MTEDEETALYEAQEAWILEKFGTMAANQANYGVEVDEYTIATKIYGYGILRSSYELHGEIDHDFEEF